MRRLSKPERERRVAETFCATLGEQWRFVRGGDKPDCVIENDAVQVGVELVRYLSPGPDNDRYEYDERFREHFYEVWIADSAVNESSVRVVYDRDHAGRATVPGPSDWRSVMAELKKLVQDHPSAEQRSAGHDREFRERKFLFVDRSDLAVMARWCGGDTLLPKEDHPAIAKQFREVGVTSHPGVILGTLHSDLLCAFVGVDCTRVRELIEDKLRRVPSYRSTFPGKVWLLVHSDGWPLSAAVGPDHCLDAGIATARAVLEAQHAGDGFDEVWWLDNTWSDRGRRARLVWPLNGS